MVDEMILVHNSLMRGLNAIYLQCVNVEKSPKDVPDFAHYAITWAQVVDEHHENEEMGLFPSIEKAAGIEGLMGVNVEQHKAFHGGLEAVEAYLQEVIDGKTAYDGKKLKALLDSFVPAQHKHLNEELPTLASLGEIDKVDWKKFSLDAIKQIKAKIKTDPKQLVSSFPVYSCSVRSS